MMKAFCAITCLVGLLSGPGLQAQELPGPVRESMDRAMARPWADRYDELYDAAELHLGAVQPLFDELLRRASAAEGERRSLLRWMASFVAWRDGDPERALRICRLVVKDRADAMTKTRVARLLDIGGRPKAAAAAYREVLAMDCDEQTESLARLRLALLALQDGAKVEADPLVEFAAAEGRGVDLRNRVANVLALIGLPKDACELYAVEGEGTRRFRDEVRLATWAIRAGDAALARDHAWRASEAAVLRRDRNYALSVLVEAYRLENQLPALMERLASSETLSEEARKVWIDLLRETGQVDEAVSLFRSSRSDFTIEMQRELIEMYREAGRDADLIGAYRELIAADPGRLAWREGLSRFYLENGDVRAARDVWQSVLTEEQLRGQLLPAASSAMELGLEEFATAAAELCIEADRDRHQALLMLFQAHRQRGRLDEAREVLDRMDRLAAPDSADRAALSEAYEQLGSLDVAVRVLEDLRAARGAQQLAEDLEMRLAWLYSQVGREEQAMECWYGLWRQVKSVARRRYVEDRLMTVAARLGKIARLVVDLERKLADGEANQQDSGLLVRLYTKVNDPVSAAEVIDEFFTQSGGDNIEALQEKARVYLACTDYASYEDIVRSLIDLDPEGKVDYLRSLVMSQLERGRPDEARAELAELRNMAQGFDSAEFEAGVLALAGLREEAVESYRRGIAAHPNRIEIYLLLANLLKETGRTEQAVGMFQHIAETAEKDDLFTIAIDGLLNMEAEPTVIQWARRITLERMAGRHDKMYLYQLLSDLSDELQDREGMFDALEGSLAIAAGRRPSILRELMDLARGPGNAGFGRRPAPKDGDRQLAYGRRLISLGEVVPPQVYLDLGQAFLAGKEITNAVKTFDLARDLADYAAFRRQVAGLYQESGYLAQALRTYKQVLVGSPSDIGLLMQVAGLEEQVGRDAPALELYRRAIDLMIDRQPVLTTKTVEEDQPEQRSVLLFRSRNVDDTGRYLNEAVTGVLVTCPNEEAVVAELERQLARLDEAMAELAQSEAVGELQSIQQSPRVERLSALCRDLAFPVSRPDLLAEVDTRLLSLFRGDQELLEKLCKERIRWGMTVSAKALVEAAERSEAEKAPLRFLFGVGEPPARAIPIGQVAGMLLPALAKVDVDTVAVLVQKANLNGATAEDVDHFATLLAAARLVGDSQSAVRVAQAWIGALFRAGKRGYEIARVHEQCLLGLEPAAQRQLDQSLVNRILGSGTKIREFMAVLPTIQGRHEDPLLTPEQITELIEESDVEFAFGLGTLLEMLPMEDRAAALRGRWAAVAKSKRLAFLLTLAAQVREPMGEELAAFLVAALPDALADNDGEFRFVTHWFERMWENKANMEVSLQLADLVLAVKPKEFEPQMLRAVALADRGEEAAAVASAAKALRVAFDKEEKYEWQNAINEVSRQFLPTHFDELLAALDDVQKPTAEQALRRLLFVERAGDSERLLSETRAAVVAFPKDQPLGQRLVRVLTLRGQGLEALEVLRALVERLPRNAALKRQLATRLRSFDRPVEALEVYRQLDRDKRPAATRAPVANATNVVKYEDPRMARVKELVEEDRLDEARGELRRLWRWGGNRSLMARSIVLLGSSVVRMAGRSGWGAWPAAPGELQNRDLTKVLRRGGMATFADPKPEPVKRQSAYEALSAMEFGLAEMRRSVRATPVVAMDGQRGLVDALLQASVAEQGRDQVLAGLLERVRSGQVNKVHFVQLLDLLEESRFSAADGISADALLEELMRTVDVADRAQLRRLAKLYGSVGRVDVAALLYRWSVLSGAVQSRLGNSVDLRSLVRAAKQHIEGPDLFALVEEILRWSKPEEDLFLYGLEDYERTSLELWEEVAGPAEALERCRSMCTDILDFRRALRRGSAKTAVSLLARAGELEMAVRCLEVGLCKLPTEEVEAEYPFQLRAYEMPGALGHEDLRKMFPKDSSSWQDPAGWFEEAGNRLLTWMGEDRVDGGMAVRAICVIACRLHELGNLEASGRLLDGLAEVESARAADALWIVDAWRATGREAQAHELERKLLRQGRLLVARAVEVVQYAARQEGAQAALQLGVEAAKITQDEALLDLLAELAAEVGEADEAAMWNKRNEEAKAARRALEERAKAGSG
ncbi:MAG: hypothetical protein VYE77_11370 [Planctomycetota bacterium]|nr:hypothetical protein [Planctomycetota bacterium]